MYKHTFIPHERYIFTKYSHLRGLFGEILTPGQDFIVRNTMTKLDAYNDLENTKRLYDEIYSLLEDLEIKSRVLYNESSILRVTIDSLNSDVATAEKLKNLRKKILDIKYVLFSLRLKAPVLDQVANIIEMKKPFR